MEKSFLRNVDPKLRLWVDYEAEQLIQETQLNDDT